MIENRAIRALVRPLVSDVFSSLKPITIDQIKQMAVIAISKIFIPDKC